LQQEQLNGREPEPAGGAEALVLGAIGRAVRAGEWLVGR
jgi:hypothetical protein